MSAALLDIADAIGIGVFWKYRLFLAGGLAYNFMVFFGAAALAVVLGTAVAVLRTGRIWWLQKIAALHTETLRNAPEYILLVWISFVPPLLLSWFFGQKLSFPALLSAILGIGLCYSGYFAEIFRAGIESIAKGQAEAARAIGMSQAMLLRRIIFPQVLRRMAPEIGNSLIALFKTTTLISLISVPDLLYRVTVVVQSEMNPMPLYTGAALIFFGIITIASNLFDRFCHAMRVG